MSWLYHKSDKIETYNLRGTGNGIMGELVLNEVEGKEIFDNLNRLFPLSLTIFQHSNIPFAPTGSMNKLPLKDY
jgi:hypothetical protein